MPSVGFTEALLNDLTEKKAQNPYKNQSTIGPAVDGGWVRPMGQPWYGGKKVKSTKESGNYDCTCKNYLCTCRDAESGRTIRFGIDRAYKKAYNARYRAWRAKAKRKAKKAA